MGFSIFLCIRPPCGIFVYLNAVKLLVFLSICKKGLQCERAVEYLDIRYWATYLTANDLGTIDGLTLRNQSKVDQ